MSLHQKTPGGSQRTRRSAKGHHSLIGLTRRFPNTPNTKEFALGKPAGISAAFIDKEAGYRSSLGCYVFQEGIFDNLSKADVDTDYSRIVSIDKLRAADSPEIGWISTKAPQDADMQADSAGDIKRRTGPLIADQRREENPMGCEDFIRRDCSNAAWGIPRDNIFNAAVSGKRCDCADTRANP